MKIIGVKSSGVLFFGVRFFVCFCCAFRAVRVPRQLQINFEWMLCYPDLCLSSRWFLETTSPGIWSTVHIMLYIIGYVLLRTLCSTSKNKPAFYTLSQDDNKKPVLLRLNQNNVKTSLQWIKVLFLAWLKFLVSWLEVLQSVWISIQSVLASSRVLGLCADLLCLSCNRTLLCPWKRNMNRPKHS